MLLVEAVTFLKRINMGLEAAIENIRALEKEKKWDQDPVTEELIGTLYAAAGIDAPNIRALRDGSFEVQDIEIIG